MTDQYAPYLDFQQKLNQVAYVVEATDTERFFIWKEQVDELKLKYVKSWDHHTLGHWQTIGELNGRPICLSASFVTIGGIFTAFVELTSQLQDYKMMEEWLDKYCPAYLDKRNKVTDAMNFSHIVRVINQQ